LRIAGERTKRAARAASAHVGGMRVARETELKLEMAGARHARILSLMAPGRRPARDTLVTTYFDSDDARLAAKGYSLRIRQQKSGTLQSVKGPAGATELALSRAEHEARLTGTKPDLTLLPGALRKEFARLLGKRALKPRFTIRVARATVLIDTATGPIELAADQGTITLPGSRRRLGFAELELESRGASPGSLMDVAQAIVAEGGAILSVQSKAARAQGFAAGEPAHPARRSTMPELDRRESASHALAKIFGACLVHIAGNVPAIIHAKRQDGVHQMRVGLRRLRAALGLSGLPKSDAAFDVMREEAGAIATALGAARDLDVFTHGFLAHAATLDDGARVEALGALVARERRVAWDKAVATAGAPSTQTFLLHASSMIEARLLGVTASPPAPLLGPAQDFAARALTKALKRVHRCGRGFPHQSEEDIHRLRLALKKLRYAAEFFAPLFATQRQKGNAKAFLKSLSRMQDVFGIINDAATARTILQRLAAEDAPAAAHAAAFVEGVVRSEARIALRDAAMLFDGFLALRPFWPTRPG